MSALPSRLDTLPWSRPFGRRCPVRLHRHDTDGPYHGRCDLARGHEGPHALERGMVVVRFGVTVLTEPS